MDFSTTTLAVERSARFRTPNAHELQCGLWVDRIGWSTERAPPNPRALRILGLYGFVAIEDGRGRFVSQRYGERTASAGDVLLVLPEDAAAYGPVGGPWRQRWVVWGGPVARQLDLWTSLATLGPVVQGAADAVASAYGSLKDRMPDESIEGAIDRDASLRRMLAQVLADSRRRGMSEAQCDSVDRVLEWLEGQFHRPVSSGELARRGGMSESHFRRMFAERTGTSPQAYLTARRIACAKQLLAEGLRVRQVAAACGFSDEFYFMRVFKRLTGTSPGAWQRTR